MDANARMEAIDELRQLNQTQKEIAKEYGVSQPTISQYAKRINETCYAQEEGTAAKMSPTADEQLRVPRLEDIESAEAGTIELRKDADATGTTPQTADTVQEDADACMETAGEVPESDDAATEEAQVKTETVSETPESAEAITEKVQVETETVTEEIPKVWIRKDTHIRKAQDALPSFETLLSKTITKSEEEASACARTASETLNTLVETTKDGVMRTWLQLAQNAMKDVIAAALEHKDQDMFRKAYAQLSEILEAEYNKEGWQEEVLRNNNAVCMIRSVTVTYLVPALYKYLALCAQQNLLHASSYQTLK